MARSFLVWERASSSEASGVGGVEWRSEGGEEGSESGRGRKVQNSLGVIPMGELEMVEKVGMKVSSSYSDA